jgi:hypothetical protein
VVLVIAVDPRRSGNGWLEDVLRANISATRCKIQPAGATSMVKRLWGNETALGNAHD